MTRSNAPLFLPSDVKAFLSSFELRVDQLLTGSNPKLLKGADTFHSVILHHLPERALARAIDPGTVGTTAPRSFIATLRSLAQRVDMVGMAARHNGCRFATAGCSAACLAQSGHGGLSVRVTDCRGRRTLARIADPGLYGRAILFAVAREYRKATTAGVPLAVRLRGTDETPWHSIRFRVAPSDAVILRRRYGLTVEIGTTINMAEVLRYHEDVRLYDYSKAPLDGPLGLIAQRRAGWDVTASFAADRITACRDAMEATKAGFRLAVPIAIKKGGAIPSRLIITNGGESVVLGCVDGDATDHRFRDPAGVAVILREKIARGANRGFADTFILPAAPLTRLHDGTVQMMWD